MGKNDRHLGVIEKARVGFVHEGAVFSFEIHITFEDGWSQIFGFYVLDYYDRESKTRLGTAMGCTALMQILSACGVSYWDELKGKSVWLGHDENENLYSIEAPGFVKHDGKFDVREWALLGTMKQLEKQSLNKNEL